MIKIQTYDKDKQTISFTSDMSLSLANAIRRSILEIPVLAVDEVEIIKNDSALYDEILAHRIGLIPIRSDKALNKEIKFKLKTIGPKTVYSSDLEPSIGIDYKLPIVILSDEQEIELIAYAKLGKGIEHVKYSPGLIYYRHNLEPDILDFVNIDAEGKISYDDDELKEKGLSDEHINRIKKIKNCDELLFTIESWGQIEVKNIFPKIIEVLDENLEELNKAVK